MVIVPIFGYAIPSYLEKTEKQAILFDKVQVIESVVIDIRKIVEKMQTQEVTIAQHDVRLDNIERQIYNEKAAKTKIR